jgi:hypothetical protein
MIRPAVVRPGSYDLEGNQIRRWEPNAASLARDPDPAKSFA